MPGEKKWNRIEGMRKTTLGRKMKNMITADEEKKTKKPLKNFFLPRL